jgi:hypothetical protein
MKHPHYLLILWTSKHYRCSKRCEYIMKVVIQRRRSNCTGYQRIGREDDHESWVRKEVVVVSLEENPSILGNQWRRTRFEMEICANRCTSLCGVTKWTGVQWRSHCARSYTAPRARSAREGMITEQRHSALCTDKSRKQADGADLAVYDYYNWMNNI